MSTASQRAAAGEADVLAAIGQAVIVTDPDGVVLVWNRAAEELYGWTVAEAVGRSILDLTVPEAERSEAELAMAGVREGTPWTGAFLVRRKDDSTFRALVTTTGVLDASGAMVAVVGVSSAIGHAVRPLLEHFTDAATVIGVDGRVAYASRAVTSLFGWLPQEIVGQPALSLVHPDDGPLLERVLRSGTSAPGLLELRVQAGDGSWRWAEAAVWDLVSDVVLRGVVLHMRDVTDRRAAHERLTRLALHDPLTGLANRALLSERIRSAAHRRGQSGALLLVDLDDLKAVNRQHGHTAGDDLLRTLATRLDEGLRVQDTCARVGGDELVVLAEGVRGPADAVELAERLQAALARPVPLAGSAVSQSASIGIALLAGRRRPEVLLRECAAAVFDAKAEGPGRVVVFDGLGSDHDGAGGLLARLRRGLDSGEVLVHYQPVVDLGSRAVVGVEALVRWQHPGQGLLAAEAFVDAAEQDDLIHELGAFVLDQACEQVCRWPGDELVLSVNVSARQLGNARLAEDVLGTLRRHRLDPARLVLEITETALMRDLATAIEVLGTCRAAGVRVSLDDFGTGFAGFGYLRELPVDEVKIDRSFVSGLTIRGSDAAIVGGIVHMARGLGLQTTGEGIETPEQAHLLTILGCDRAQGHLWSPAVPGGDRPPGTLAV